MDQIAKLNSRRRNQWVANVLRTRKLEKPGCKQENEEKETKRGEDWSTYRKDSTQEEG